jgi:undecaprenyl-diphosphatase
MLELIKAVIFGIVEGITEWLPISSTGHMILLNEFLTLHVSTAFWDMFLIVIQLGAILAVVLLFWKQIWPFGWKRQESTPQEKTIVFAGVIQIRMDIIINWMKIIVSCLPAVLFVLLGLDDVCDALFYNPVCVAIALIVFGVAFLVVEKHNRGKRVKVEEMTDITWKMAAFIGIFQLLAAAFPGTSRSGATIIGALLLGISRRAASEYTFILAIPVMFGASLLKIFDFGFSLSASEWMILLGGMGSAFLVSLVVIRFLLSYIRKHDFTVFGWYRIVLGIVVLIYFCAK